MCLLKQVNWVIASFLVLTPLVAVSAESNSNRPSYSKRSVWRNTVFSNSTWNACVSSK